MKAPLFWKRWMSKRNGKIDGRKDIPTVDQTTHPFYEQDLKKTYESSIQFVTHEWQKKDQGLKEDYCRAIAVAQNLTDRIIIEAIQTRSAINAVYPVNRELPVFSSWKDNALVFRTKMLKLKKEIRDKVETFLDCKGSENTEIMSAFLPAQQLFKSYPEYTRKILVIMSDMIEESPNHNFVKYLLGEKKTMNIIATEKKRKCLPCLNGVTVYVIGAGGKSTSRMIKLKEFWLKYFNACGAEVQPGNYGAGLARFAE